MLRARPALPIGAPLAAPLAGVLTASGSGRARAWGHEGGARASVGACEGGAVVTASHLGSPLGLLPSLEA